MKGWDITTWVYEIYYTFYQFKYLLTKKVALKTMLSSEEWCNSLYLTSQEGGVGRKQAIICMTIESLYVLLG